MDATCYASQSKDGSILYLYVFKWPKDGPLVARIEHEGQPVANGLSGSASTEGGPGSTFGPASP